MDQRFGIAVGSKPVPGANQIAAKLLIVIDFAVEHDPYRTVFIRNRLMTGVEIDNAQAPHADRAIAIYVIAFVIRTAMPDRIAHRPDAGQVRRFMPQKLSGDPAHIVVIISDQPLQ